MGLALKPNLLCIAPPYPINSLPSGAASLLGYLKAAGCHDFGFLDLRLFVPYAYAPTYRHMGMFGESYVIDVPDLPLVLRVLRAFDEGRPLIDEPDLEFDTYCAERGINRQHLYTYLVSLDRFFDNAFDSIKDLRFVGFSVWTSNYLPTLMAAAKLKRRKSPPFIVAGGPQVTESENAAKLALRAGVFDAVALGEGEETLLSLYEEFVRGGGHVTKPVEGTMQVDSTTGRFVVSERKLLRLKELPAPSFDEMQVAGYPQHWDGLRSIPYQLSRGCTDECSFCSEWVFWRQFRLTSMSKAVEHLLYLKQRYGYNAVWFTDSLLNGQMARLRDFARELIDRKANLLWSGFMRANMDPEMAKLIFDAGCREVFIGVESLSDETLLSMNKRRTVADNIRALETFLQAGIQVVAGLIPGFPADTRARFVRTVTVLRELQNTYPHLRISSEPFLVTPGQPIFKNVESMGLKKIFWPEEILDFAPKYRDITENIPWRVEGANQGLDRLGEFRLARALHDAVANAHFGFEAGETHSPFSINHDHLWENYFLASTKTPTGLMYGVILTPDERATLAEIELASNLGTIPAGQSLERPRFNEFFKAVEAAHVIAPRRDRPLIAPSYYIAKLEETTRVALSPFVIARELSDELVLIYNFNSKSQVRLLGATAVLSLLNERGSCTIGELEAFAKASGTEAAFGREQLMSLKEAGVLVATDAPAYEQPVVDIPAATPERGQMSRRYLPIAP